MFAMSESPKFRQITKYKSRIEKRKERLALRSCDEIRLSVEFGTVGFLGICDPDLRLAGAAYGGSKETSTTVCGDEGRCVVCNLRKSRLFADCLLLYDLSLIHI